jgi:hypothetical protein
MDQTAIDHLDIDLLRALPDEGPVTMLNVMRFRERSGFHQTTATRDSPCRCRSMIWSWHHATSGPASSGRLRAAVLIANAPREVLCLARPLGTSLGG